ncbi:GT-D fold domain-containing glycosyltransferase [Paenibacillus sp. Marseille-Q4541]|uniref:GT-D fold domain-containing protein n=1 Tax=Paenibacillus sp. Marseille-Q4541 TaxID=2831522 RepID=UPI001BA772D4|nr:GT-D fold domain-containing glycosyltransferase [Paenibacillus sp. Marseille-Q4541]
MGRDVPRKQKGERSGKPASRHKGGKSGAKPRDLQHGKRERKNRKQRADKQRKQKGSPNDTGTRSRSSLQSLHREAMYLGGEALVEKWMPEGKLLPHITCEELIQAGLTQYKSHMIQLAGTSEIRDVLRTALEERQPLSLVRLGDGELLSLAYETVMSPAEVHELGAFLPYAGVPVPDASVRRSLVHAIQSADYIGVPISRKPAFQLLMFPLFEYYSLSIRALKLTTSTINYSLYQSGYLLPLLEGRRVLLIGNKAESVAEELRRKGIQVTGTIYPVSGFQDIDRVLALSSLYEYDIGLVAAGVPAVIICQRIAAEYKKVAIDIGHVADEIVKDAAVLG